MYIWEENIFENQQNNYKTNNTVQNARVKKVAVAIKYRRKDR